MPDDTWILNPLESKPPLCTADEDTWLVSRVCGTFKERKGWHGCQMPEAVLDRIILVSSNKKDIILDPFLGSGTTLAAAKRLERQFLGFDISPEYCELAKLRLQETDTPLFQQQD